MSLRPRGPEQGGDGAKPERREIPGPGRVRPGDHRGEGTTVPTDVTRGRRREVTDAPGAIARADSVDAGFKALRPELQSEINSEYEPGSTSRKKSPEQRDEDMRVRLALLKLTSQEVTMIEALNIDEQRAIVYGLPQFVKDRRPHTEAPPVLDGYDVLHPAVRKELRKHEDVGEVVRTRLALLGLSPEDADKLRRADSDVQRALLSNPASLRDRLSEQA